jgi:hypothetical protein
MGTHFAQAWPAPAIAHRIVRSPIFRLGRLAKADCSRDKVVKERALSNVAIVSKEPHPIHFGVDRSATII